MENERKIPNKYVLVYKLIDLPFKELIRKIDKENLNGIYVPEHCVGFELYTRENFDKKVKQDQIFNHISELTSKMFDEVAEEFPNEDPNDIASYVEDEINNMEFDPIIDEEIEITKYILIGEKMSKKEVAQEFGPDSFEYRSILENEAEGIVYFEKDYDFNVIDYYYEDDNLILGGLDNSGHLILANEDENSFNL